MVLTLPGIGLLERYYLPPYGIEWMLAAMGVTALLGGYWMRTNWEWFRGSGPSTNPFGILPQPTAFWFEKVIGVETLQEIINGMGGGAGPADKFPARMKTGFSCAILIVCQPK
jgi:hypothetical protein